MNATVIALNNAARLLASHAADTIKCPAEAETALAVALDCLEQAAALSPDFGEQALMDKVTYALNDLDHRLVQAYEWVSTSGQRNIDAAIAQAAHIYNVDREHLAAKYDAEYKAWAAARGYDF